MQLQQLAAQLGVLFQRVLSHDVAAKIRRIEVPVVLQHHEALVGHLPVGGGHDDGIHLALEQRLVLQADVHVSRGAEVHVVGLLQSGVAVLPVEEVGLGAQRQAARCARQVGIRVQVVALGRVAAHSEAVRVVEPVHAHPGEA